MSMTVRISVLILLAGMSATALASEIEGSCMVSFNVKDKIFNNGVAAISCRALEARRLDLFKQVSSLPTSGSLDVASTTQALSALEARLKALEDNANWAGWATSITGNGLATIGLSSCAETIGAGCAVAVISKVLAVVGLVNSGVSDANKAQEVKGVRDSIAALRSKLAASTTPASTIRDRMVAESNQICAEVKTNCLTN